MKTLLPSHTFLRLTHPSPQTFLTRISTSTIHIHPNKITPTLLLSPKGRILHELRIHNNTNNSDNVLIECHTHAIKGIRDVIAKYAIREKWELTQEGDAVWNPQGTDPRAEGIGCIEMSTGNTEQMQNGEIEYTMQRYKIGLAQGPEEIPIGIANPLEYNMDIMHAIDFKKGCYPGQELTIRTHHTGVVRKRVLPVQLFTDIDMTIPLTQENSLLFDGNAIIRSVDGQTPMRGAKAIGRVGHYALALIRLPNTLADQVPLEVVDTSERKAYLRYEIPKGWNIKLGD